jgi:hypothetical protein
MAPVVNPNVPSEIDIPDAPLMLNEPVRFKLPDKLTKPFICEKLLLIYLILFLSYICY